MKLIIAGGREINPSFGFITEALRHFKIEPTEIVSGEARGVDTAGKLWCEKIREMFGQTEMGLAKFPVSKEEWDTIGKGAGHARNRKMASYGDVLLLIWDGSSGGSRNMKEEMQKLGKPIYEIILKKP